MSRRRALGCVCGVLLCVGLLWGLARLLTPATARACDNGIEVNIITAPSEMMVCSSATITAEGTPPGGTYVWGATFGWIEGDGSSVTFHAPNDVPNPAQVTVAVWYYIDDPNVGAGDSVDIAIAGPNDCSDGPATGLTIELHGDATGWLHFNDDSDWEEVGAVGMDPDDTSCGCPCSSNGIDLDATEWRALGNPRHIEVANAIGATTRVWSKDTYVGDATLQATFHDYTTPTVCDDDEGANWTDTHTFKVFKVGAEVEGERLYEDAISGSYWIHDSKLDEIELSKSTTDAEVGSGSLPEQEKYSQATFKLVTMPNGANPKKDITAWIGGWHKASGVTGSVLLRAIDTDEQDDGWGAVTVGVASHGVAIAWTLPWELNDPDPPVVGIVSLGYGACIKGGTLIKLGKTLVTSGYEETDVPIAAWNPDEVEFAGSPGDTRWGEVKMAARIEWDDDSTGHRMSIYVHADPWTSFGDIQWKITRPPQYGP